MSEALATWVNLNSVIITMGEEECQSLFEEEKKGKHRKMFLLRIHSRMNKLRADRERQIIERIAASEDA